MTRRVAIDWDDLELAASWSDPEGRLRYLDVETGGIVFPDDEEDWPEERVDEAVSQGRLVPVEPIESSVAYGWMEDFVEALPEGPARDRLAEALDGRRPFRRFKDALAEHGEVRDRWFAFERQRRQEALVEWLLENDLEPTTPPSR